jgi:hypothetical protein
VPSRWWFPTNVVVFGQLLSLNEALECGKLLPLSAPRACSPGFQSGNNSPLASRLKPKRQQAAALQSFSCPRDGTEPTHVSLWARKH